MSDLRRDCYWVLLISCDICTKVFETELKLKSHLKTSQHKHDFKTRSECFQNGFYFCVLCGKNFKTFAGLQKHENSTHLGISYKCELCDKAFTQGKGFKWVIFGIFGDFSYRKIKIEGIFLLEQISLFC